MNEPLPSPVPLAEALQSLQDPRRRQRRTHELVPLLLMAVAAMLCGARSLYAIAQWGRDRREDAPEQLIALGLKPGMSPSVATLHRVFKRLDVEAFEAILGRWIAGLQADRKPSSASPDALEVMALDGKTLRGIHGEEIPGVHLVAAYAAESGAVLGQHATTGKGRELEAARAVLARVPLADRVVVGDALLTQREICEQIVSQGGTTASP